VAEDASEPGVACETINGGLRVQFHSDSTVQSTGFAFSYRELAALPPSPPAPSSCTHRLVRAPV
jgi:hypothetical protein